MINYHHYDNDSVYIYMYIYKTSDYYGFDNWCSVIAFVDSWSES